MKRKNLIKLIDIIIIISSIYILDTAFGIFINSALDLKYSGADDKDIIYVSNYSLILMFYSFMIIGLTICRRILVNKEFKKLENLPK